MKNSLIYSFLTLALAAGLAASCTREPMAENSGAPEQITATIAQLAVGIEETTLGTDAPQTKTAVGAFDSEHKAQLTWSENDQITVTDAAGKTAVYTLDEDDGDEDLGPGKTEAKFTLTSAQTDFGTGPFTATYGTKPAAYQTITPGTSVPGGLYMEAAEVDNLRGFSFEVKCGLLSLKLTSATEKTVTQIVISGAPGEYTVTPSGGSAAVSTEGAPFVIPLMPGRYSEVRVYDGSTPAKAVAFKSGVNITAAHLQPATAALPEDAAVQHDFVTIGGLQWATMNIGATTAAGSPETCYGDYFAWGETETYLTYAPRASGTGTCTFRSDAVGNGYNSVKTGYNWTNYNHSSSFTEWATIPYNSSSKVLTEDYDVASQKWGGGWRMPTKDEFGTLFSACGGTGNSWTGTINTAISLAGDVQAKGVYYCTSVDGILGTLFSDGYSQVFFPAAGRVKDTSLEKNLTGTVGGCYWSSTLAPTAGNAYYMSFRQSNVYISDNFNRYLGFTVRAVRNIPAPDDLPGTEW